MSMPWPPLLSALWETTGSDVQVAAAGALRMLPYVALSAFGGMLADRLRRSTVLRWSTALRTGLLACCAVALATDHVAWAVGFGTLTVAVGTPCYPAAVSSMPELAGPLSPRLTSLLVTAEVTAFVAGPALGGVLIGMGNGSWATAASATICLLGALLLAGVRTGPVVPATGRTDHGRLRTVLRCPGVPDAIAAIVVVNFVLSAASIGLVTLSYESWGSGDRGYGIAAAALGFGSLAALFLAPVLRFRGSLLASGSGLAATGVAPGVAVAATPLAVTGAAATLVECISTDILQRSVPDHLRAFSLGLTDAAMVAAALLGALLQPVLASVTGPATAFVVLAAALWLFAGLVRPPRPGRPMVALAGEPVRGRAGQ
jgi:MFS family permease